MRKKILDAALLFAFALCLIVTSNIQEEAAYVAELENEAVPLQNQEAEPEEMQFSAGVAAAISANSFTTESDEKTGVEKKDVVLVTTSNDSESNLEEETDGSVETNTEVSESGQVEEVSGTSQAPAYNNRWNARKEEVEHAEEEGIIFKTLNNPVEILGNDEGMVCGMKCVEMELGEPDESGRRRPVEKPDSEFVLDVDSVIMSIGTSPNPLIRSTTPGLEANNRGCLITKDESGLTTRDNVYAGGDAVTGAATVILAMGAGKAAAKAIDEALRG